MFTGWSPEEAVSIDRKQLFSTQPSDINVLQRLRNLFTLKGLKGKVIILTLFIGPDISNV